MARQRPRRPPTRAPKPSKDAGRTNPGETHQRRLEEKRRLFEEALKRKREAEEKKD